MGAFDIKSKTLVVTQTKIETKDLKIESDTLIINETKTTRVEKSFNRQYTYIIAIRPSSHTIFGKNNRFYVDMFLEIKEKDMKDLGTWLDTFEYPIHPNDPLTPEEVTEITKITPINIPLNAMALRARMNPGTTIHVFYTEFKMSAEMFDDYISCASFDPDIIEKLKKSRIV